MNLRGDTPPPTASSGRVGRRAMLSLGGASLLGLAATERSVDGVRSHPLRFYGHPSSLLPPDPDAPLAESTSLIWQVRTSRRAIALTFDDGPDLERTTAVLKAVDAREVPATFFLLGRNVARVGPLHKLSSGRHEFGNHTHTHTDLGRLGFTGARDELARCNDEIESAFGVRPTLFRPPYGHVSAAALVAAASLGLDTVLWTARFRESRFRKDPDGIVADTCSQVGAGGIVLGHDSGTDERSISISRLPAILDALLADGWTFHTVSGLRELAE